jgi:ADP-ribosylation factor-like protein 3
MGGGSSAPRKVVFFGLDNAGKSSVVAALTGTPPSAVAPTRGFSAREREFGGALFQIFDVGGQRSLRGHWGDYLAGAAGIVWVVDSADPRRMYETGLEFAALLGDARARGVPLLVLANKKDLAAAMAPADIAVALELSLLRDRDWRIQECSAITRDPRESGIEGVARWMEERLAPKAAK